MPRYLAAEYLKLIVLPLFTETLASYIASLSHSEARKFGAVKPNYQRHTAFLKQHRLLAHPYTIVKWVAQGSCGPWIACSYSQSRLWPVEERFIIYFNSVRMNSALPTLTRPQARKISQRVQHNFCHWFTRGVRQSPMRGTVDPIIMSENTSLLAN